MHTNLMTGADILADLLTEHGTEIVFAYPGTSELAICASLARAPIRLVNSRGDKEAAFMAGGASRLRAGAGAAVLHGARGLTNALGAIADLRRSEVGILCIVGLPSRASAQFLPPHAEPQLISGAAAFAKDAFECTDEETFAETVASALAAVASVPFGPVLLGIPDDLACAPLKRSHSLAAPITSSSDHDNLSAAIRLVDAAQSPMIIVDDYAFNGDDDLEALLDSLAIPVFQVHYRRGPMLFHQARHARKYNMADPAVRAAVENADLLITVEDRNMYPRVVGKLPACRRIALTTNPVMTRKNGYLRDSDILVTGNVAKSLSQLPIPANGNAEAVAGETHELVSAIADALATVPNPVLIDDSQMLGGLIARYYHLLPQGLRVFGSHGGFVGSGLATAIGAALAYHDRSLLCALGDQGYTNALQALAAASETNAPVVFLVCNNGSSVSLRKQAAFDGRRLSILENTPSMDYCRIASAFGIPTTTIHWPDPALSTVLTDAMKSRAPFVIELMTPGDLDFWSGVWQLEGLEVNETPLPSDTTKVAKVAGTVRRTTGPWTPSVHGLLSHLEQVGFSGAPRPRGLDDQGREVLTFIEGVTATRPWPNALRTDQGLAELGGLLRRYHDAAASYRPDAQARWANGRQQFGPGEVVRHGDFGPWNVVWRDGVPVAIIDWDLACPGDPILDLAQAALFAVPLQGPDSSQLAGFHEPPDLAHRLKVLCQGYGSTCQPVEVLNAIDHLCELEIHRMRTLDGKPWDDFRDRGRIDEYQGYQQWLRHNLPSLIERSK